MRRFKLIEDWRCVARKAWSFRFGIAASVFSGLEVAIPYLPDSVAEHVGRGTFAALAGLVSVAASISRVVSQPRMRR